MFDLGWSEILVIAIVMIVVVGPKDLPRVLRSFGRTTSKLRVMAGDFRRQFDDALREAELDDVKNLVDDVRKMDPRNEIRKHFNPLEQAGKDIKKDLDKATLAQPAPSPEPSTETLAQPVEPLKSGPTELPGETTPASKADGEAEPVAKKTAAAPKSATTKSAAAKTSATKPAATRKPAAKKAATAAADGAAAPKPKVARAKKNIGSDAQ